MNVVMLNNASLDGDVVVKRGGGSGGGVPINNQVKSVDIVANGTTDVTPDAGFTGLSKVSVNVNVPSSGSTAPVSKGDVTFYDYDGTILHSYTKDEFLALSAMPSLPERKGLICQGWNYNLEDAIAYVSKYSILDVGATYITDDGKTRLYIRIAAKGRMDVPLYFSQSVANGVVIDWGDGSETQTLNYTGNRNTTHKYAEIGDYVITLDPIEGCTLRLESSASNYSVMGNVKAYGNMLQKVEVGRHVTSIGNQGFCICFSLASVVIPNSVTSIEKRAFEHCYSLASVVIPNSVTSIENNMFMNCSSLASVVMPDSVTSIGNSVFNSCSSLASVVIPEGVTGIGTQAFSNCPGVASLVIPDSVTSIENYMFMNCYGVAFYDFSTHTAVPTLSATNAFNEIPSDCKIIVPDTLYDEWIAATNWALLASKIVKASEFNA